MPSAGSMRALSKSNQKSRYELQRPSGAPCANASVVARTSSSVTAKKAGLFLPARFSRDQGERLEVHVRRNGASGEPAMQSFPRNAECLGKRRLSVAVFEGAAQYAHLRCVSGH